MSATLFQRFIFVMEIWLCLCALHSGKRTLYQQRLEIMYAISYFGRFLLSCAFIVRRRQPCLARKGGIILPHRHIGADLTEDIQRRHRCDPDHRSEMPDDAIIFLTIVFQFVIDHGNAFFDLSNVHADDLKLIPLHTDKFITMGCFSSSFSFDAFTFLR